MYTVKNPDRSRPLSPKVRRLMKMARESPLNPNVEKIERDFAARDLAYCDMQGNIFMAAIDLGIPMSEFAPIYMNSQLAGVIDYSFSRAGGMEEDDIATYLRMPVLLQSPAIIVDTVMWLNEIVSHMNPGESLNMAVANALSNEELTSAKNGPEPVAVQDGPEPIAVQDNSEPGESVNAQLETDVKAPVEPDIETLADDYEYAYWLGYIYRCECHMHEESSRMVYGAFNEAFMRDFYGKLSLGQDTVLAEYAPEICRRLDALLVGKLWKTSDDKAMENRRGEKGV